ncbi:MAG: choice-of-anchor D domain-containing protein, partial [Candidatus Cloacimonetes bacterium]|nr:choice-of-anchor D domain-containing protein [Candidatus Cloacimonadota bacterium]
MKRQLLLILLIMAMSLGFAATYQIGSGAVTLNYVPFYGLYDYSSSKAIYTAAEIAAAGLNSPEGLIAIGYEIANTPNNYLMEDQFVYMRHTDATVYEDNNMVSSDGFTLVYSGDITFNGGGWFYLTLDTPFPYDGSSGIEILWENRDGAYVSGYPTFKATTMSNMAAYKYQDNTFPEAPIAGTWATSRPNLTLASPQTTPPNAATLVAPANGGLVVADSVTLQWADGGGFPTGYKIYIESTASLPVIQDLGNVTSYVINDLGEDATYYWKVVPYNGNGDQTNVPIWTFDANPEGLVVIGDGTLTQRFPFGHLFGFERSASVYPFDEIGAVGVVERIGWNCTAVGTMPVPYKIYLGTINETEMTQQPYNTMIEDMTLVSEGELTFTSLGWILFDLDTPFVYTGGNLVVAVEVNYGGGGGQATERFTYTGGHTNKHIYWTADNNPPTTNGTRTALRPNLMMQLGELTGDPELAVSPVSINFGDAIFGATIGPRNISLSNIGGGSLTVTASDVSLTGSTQFSYDNSVFPLVLGSGETLQIPVTLVGTIEGPAEAAITITYGTQTFVVELSANVLPDGLVIIGNGTANNYMPVNTYYGYSYAQMLYRADEIMTADRQIEKVAYHWNGAGAAPNTSDWTIYMGHTDKEAFASTTDWIALDDLVQVYQGTVEMTAVNQWIEIELNLPFIYDGVDNLVIAVRETFPGYDSSSYFFYNTPSTTGRSIRCQNDSTVPDPAAPPTGTLTAAYPNIRMFFGDVPDNPVISVSPENINFGTIFFNAQSDVRNVTVFNAGGGTLQLGAAAVQITGENAALFSFDDSVFPFALETGESAQIPVSLVGSVEGNVVASLEITYAGEVSTVGLSANVLPDGVVIVGNGTLTQRQPFGGLYGYERSVGLYKADEIASVGSIYNIGWHLSTANVNIMPYKIYLGVTNDEVLTAQTFADISANMTLVKEGTHLFENLGWNNFELDTPYIYTGGNLLVAVESNYGGTGGFGTINFNYTSATALHMNWQTDNNPPAVNGTVNANRPNLMLMLGALDGDPELAVNPAAINFGDVVFGATLAPRNINLSNIGGGVLTVTATDVSFVGSDQFSYDTSILPATIGSAETIQIPVTMTGTVEGPAAATITITHAGEEFEVALSANVLPDGLVVIGDGTTNSYMPVNTFYGYSYAQMLYKADEIMTQDRQLEKVAYHWNGAGAAPNSDQWTIYIGHTDKEAFANTTDWIGVNDLTVVYQGTVTMPAENMWIEIELETPFIYNGVDNLVIAVRETQPSYDSSSYFFYNTASTTGRSIRYQSDSIIPDPAAPPTGTLMAAYPNIRMYFGDIPTEPVLAVSPNVDEWDFGLKPALSTTTKAFTIANNGSGVLTVNNVVVTGAGFALQETFESVGLASTESVVITVVYSPADVGDYEGLLAITTSHGNREIDLVGSCYNPIITEFPFFEGFEVGNTEGSTTIAQWEQIIGTEYATQSWTANSANTTYARTPRSGDWNVTLRYNGESTLVRPIMLEAGETYSLEFWARQDAASGATIEAILGDNDQLIGDIIEIVPASPVYAGDYQQFTGEFEVAVSGLYYLGIYGYVTITPWYISLDDISIYQGEIPEDLVPPSYLRASVDGMEVQLAWNAPGDDIPPAGTPQWITWCDVNTYGQNAIGTGNAAVFDVAHRFDENDLASVQEMALTKMKFVPNQVDCVYTAKVWVGTSAAAPSTLVHSQVVTNPTIGAWNEVVFTTPIPIPAIGELWFGYEANTQTGHPAGVDAGPPVAGKGNMFYFNNQWMELTAAGATLTYNWSIQGFVDNVTPPASARVLKSIPEEPRGVVLGANFSALHNVISPSVSLNSRALTRDLNGYKVYRDDSLIATVTNPATLTYLDEVAAAGVYSYTVTAIYDGGESEPAGPVEVEVEAPAAPVFAITPTSHNFGQVNVGSTQSQQFTISNAGAGTLTINAITISGAMMSLGTLPTLPVNLTAGQTLEFNANYTPTAEGAHTGAITITDNLTRIAHTVALSGTGVDMGDLYPPTNLQASVSGMDVTLTWEPPVTGEWITWCIPEDIGNGIGTNSAATFDVAHRFDANDLAPY